MSEFDFNPAEFYTAHDQALINDFANLTAYNRRTIEEITPSGALDRQDIELLPFDYSGENQELAGVLKAQMVKSLGLDTQIDVLEDDSDLDYNATVFEFSNVHVALKQIDTAQGKRYFVAKYDAPVNKDAKTTGQIQSLSVFNEEGFDRVLRMYRVQDVKDFLKIHLGLNSETMSSLEMSLEDMQAMARSYAEISKLEEHDPSKLPDMPDIDKMRKKALRSIKRMSFVGLMLGDDVEDEAVNNYVEYIEASTVSVTEEVYKNVIRLEQAKRIKAMQDRIERRVKTADTGHAIKTVGLTAIMGATGYGLGLLYDSDYKVGMTVEQGFQSNNAWKAALGLGALQLVNSLVSVRKYMKHRSLIKATPMSKAAFSGLDIVDQIRQEAVAFSRNMRLSKVQY